MKKLLLFAFVLTMLPTVGLVSLVLFAANRIGSNSQDTFFAAIATGDTSELTSLFDPSLTPDFDEPVLKEWMDAVNERLGAYRGIEVSNFETKSGFNNGNGYTLTKNTVKFEKGTGVSELIFSEGKIAGFNFQSDQLKGEWFEGPANTQLYQERSLEFYNAFVADESTTARSQMSEALADAVSLEELTQMRQSVEALAGEIEDVQVLEDEFFRDDEGPKLRVKLLLAGTKANLASEAIFQFDGLKGHLVEFVMKRIDE